MDSARSLLLYACTVELVYARMEMWAGQLECPRTAWQPLTYPGNSPRRMRRSCKSKALLDKLDNGLYRFIFERTGLRVSSFQ